MDALGIFELSAKAGRAYVRAIRQAYRDAKAGDPQSDYYASGLGRAEEGGEALDAWQPVLCPIDGGRCECDRTPRGCAGYHTEQVSKPSAAEAKESAANNYPRGEATEDMPWRVCGTERPAFPNWACSKPAGHDGDHGYAAFTWPKFGSCPTCCAPFVIGRPCTSCLLGCLKSDDDCDGICADDCPGDVKVPSSSAGRGVGSPGVSAGAEEPAPPGGWPAADPDLRDLINDLRVFALDRRDAAKDAIPYNWHGGRASAFQVVLDMLTRIEAGVGATPTPKPADVPEKFEHWFQK